MTKPLRAADVQIVELAPEQAIEMLEKNQTNRRIRRKVVEAYRRDMETGRWAFTAEPIQISVEGNLLNGQHRLTALAGADPAKIKENYPGGFIPMVLATGIEEHVQTMMDQGVPRNVRDALLISQGHVKNVTIVASICRMVAVSDMPGPDFTSTALRSKVTTAEALSVFERYPEIAQAAEVAASMRNYLKGSPSAVGYTWLAFHRLHPSKCAEFFRGFVDLDFTFKKDPRKAVIRRMEAVHEEFAVSQETAVMTVSVLTRAWNAWLKDEEVETILVKSRSGPIPPVRPLTPDQARRQKRRELKEMEEELAQKENQ